MNTIRATALSLASTVTLAVLASINFMATSPAPDSLLTSIAGAADQTIVLEARRDRG